MSYVPRTGKRYVSSPKCPDWHFGPFSFLFQGYKGTFLLGKGTKE
jgi:hypothetical protein